MRLYLDAGVMEKKCGTKGIAVQPLASIEKRPVRTVLLRLTCTRLRSGSDVVHNDGMSLAMQNIVVEDRICA